jgi:uncharacterized protein (TIGR03437 family)
VAAFLVCAASLRADISLSLNAANAAAGGATGQVQIINSGQPVSWNAASDQSWLTFTSATSGGGNGSVSYSVAGNPAATSRVANVTVTPSSGSAQTLVVTQLGGILSISPSSANLDASGRTGSITIFTEDPSLQWVAVSNQDWLTIASGATGIGSGTVQWNGAANITASARTATITVTPLNGVGQPFTVSQQASSNPAQISVSPSSVNADASGATGSLQVTANTQSVTWTATSNQPFVTITSGGSGQGNGTIQFTVTANGRAATKSANITVTSSTGQSIVVPLTQSGGVLVLSPASANVPMAQTSGSFTLTTSDSALEWSIVSSQPWLTVTSSTSGKGSATVAWLAAANTSNTAQSATITITPAGGNPLTFSVNQAAAVTGTITLSPGSASAPPSISNGSIQVTTSGPSLTWTASSDQPWLTFTPSFGTGNGTIQYTATGNTAATQRTGTITVAPNNGPPVMFVLTQAATTISISPSSASVLGSGGSGSFSFTTNNSTLLWSVSIDQPWLTITSPSSGTADATMNWAAATNQSTTSRTATITISPATGSPLTFTVTQQGLTGTISSARSTASFAYQQLQSLPTDIQIAVTSNGVPLPFTASATTTAGGPWLTVTTNGASTPAVIDLSVTPQNLAAGVYQGTVTITSSTATNSPISIAVTLTVSPALVLNSQPNAVTFSVQQNGPPITPQTVLLTTSGLPSDTLPFTIGTDPTAPWLSASGAGPAPATLTITANPAGLPPGTYQGTVPLMAPAAGNSPLNIPVTLTVTAAPTISASPASLSFTYRQLDPAPSPVSFSVTSSGTNLQFNATISPSSSWLHAAITRNLAGQTPSTIDVTIDPTGLAPGSYQSSIVLTASAAGNSPLTVPVTLTVTSAATITAQPQQLSFTVTQGGASAPSGSILISADSAITVAAAATTVTGGNWLSVQSSGSQTPATLTVQIQAAGLPPGLYTGAVTVTSAQGANSPVIIPVRLTVSPQPSLIVLPTALSFFYQSLIGALPPKEFLAVAAPGTSQASVTTSVTTASGGNWLLADFGATTPGLLAVSVNPSSLTPGTYSGSVTLNSPGFAPVTIPVSIRVASTPVLNVTPTSLNFSYQQGTAAPQPQSVAMSASSGSLGFSVAVAPGASWLNVTGGGRTPASFSVAVSPQGLAPGAYNGTILVTSLGAGNSPVPVPVQLTVTAAPVISATPSSLNFTYTQQGTLPDPQTLHIFNAQTLSFSTSVSAAESWLNVSGDGPTPATLNVSVDPSGLTPGQYTASILINAPSAANNPLIIPVSFTVQAAPSLVPTPSQITFSYQVGGMLPANQILTVGDPSLIVSAIASTTSGGNWLSVMGGGSAGSIFSLTATPGTLTPGTYQGSVSLSASNAGNSPVSVPVTLIVTAAPVLRSAPGQLSFSYQVGNPFPASGILTVTSSGDALAFTVSATTDSGGSWLSISAGGSTPGIVTASVNPTGLTPGTYTGTISLSSAGAGNSPLLIPVTFTIGTSTNLTGVPSSLQFTAQVGVGAPAPQFVHLDFAGGPIGLTYAVSPGASWLTYSGDASTPGMLSVAVSPIGLTPGRYTAAIEVQSSFAANSPLVIPITFDVAPQPVITLASTTLQYFYTIGGARPPGQSFAVGSSATPIDYMISVVPGPSWLFASGTGTTPANVSVTVDPGALTPGQYQGTVLVTPSGSGMPLSIQVILTVTNAPVLSAQPSGLSFAYQVNGPAPPNASLLIISDSGSQQITLGSMSFSGGNWLTVTGGGSTPAAVTLLVDPAGLTPGVYSEEIIVMASGVANSPLLIPVTLTVTSAPALIATPGGLSFAALVNGTPPNQQIALTSSDGSAISIGSIILSNAGIPLTITSSSSTTPATLTVAAATAGLSTGVYQSSIVVSSNTAGNSPLVIPMTITISAQPGLVVSPPSATFSAAPGGGSQTAQLIVSSTSTPLNFGVSVGPGASWLSVTGAGTTPTTIQIAVNPAGLAAGAYQGTVLVTSPGSANAVVSVPVSLLVTAGPLLISTQALLTFTGVSTSVLSAQTLPVSSTGSSVTVTAAASGSTPWLSVSGGGNTPLNLTVSANPAGLAPGVYEGSVQIFAASAGNSPFNVPVVLIVTAAATLQANPSPLSFSYNIGAMPPGPQSLALSLGGQPAAGASSMIAPGTPWLSLTNPSGGNINVAVNPNGLLPGTYGGTILTSSSDSANSPLATPVNLVVTGLPGFDISQDAIAFTAVTAQSQPISTTIFLNTGNNPPVTFEADITASTWLSITPTSGMTPATITVTVDPTNLRAGNYSGSVILSSSGNRIRTIPVNLTVADQPALGVSPPFLEFAYAHGGNAPAPVNIYLGRFGANISVLAAANVPWISVNPSTPSTSGPITVTVTPGALSAGVYHGAVTLTVIAASGQPSATPPRQVPVTLYVDQPTAPQIFSVVNGMSFLNTPLTPGLIFSIFGTGLGPATPVGGQVQPDQTLSQTLGGVQVLVNGIPCPLLYVSDDQINAIAPYALYTKDAASVAVRYMGVSSDEAPLQVSPSAPGVFSVSQAGAGPGAILNQDLSVNTSANPATKGTYISVFAGGGGQSTPQGIDGLLTAPGAFPPLLLPVSVTIGGVAATDIQYAGPAPGFPNGALQVNVRIPATVGSGDLPVALTVGAGSSQTGLTVSVR